MLQSQVTLMRLLTRKGEGLQTLEWLINRQPLFIVFHGGCRNYVEYNDPLLVDNYKIFLTKNLK